MRDAPSESGGLRERKRRETRQRIAEVGLKSFLGKGYEATTIDEIAEAAGISRRTFFHYFQSKDDIFLVQVGNYVDWLRCAVLEDSPAGAPIDVAHDALLKLVKRFKEPELIATAQLMRANKDLRARRYAGYAHFEQALYEGLCELWPEQKRREGLRLVAITSIGALRLSVETWLQQNGKRPLTRHIQDAFKRLKAEI